MTWRSRDRFSRQARREGLLARSVFKLEELNRRFRLFGPGGRVLDLGACPGSWTRYILDAVGPSGVACAVDRNPIDRQFKGRVHFVRGDLAALAPDAFARHAAEFDAVVSDLAPDTSGIRALDQARSEELAGLALAWAGRLLARGGHFACKLFDGPGTAGFRRRAAALFGEVRLAKPKACRRESFELYVVGLGKKG